MKYLSENIDGLALTWGKNLQEMQWFVVRRI